MIWNYGFNKNEKLGNLITEEYQTRCGMLVCTAPAGCFKKDGIYPYYCRGGYAHIVALDITNHTTTIYDLASLGDTYQIIGVSAELEEAEFEVI